MFFFTSKGIILLVSSIYVFIMIFLVISFLGALVNREYLLVFVSSIMIGIWVYEFRKIKDAYRRRHYDSQYAEAKQAVYKTLQSLLPLAGEFAFKEPEVQIYIRRSPNPLLRNIFGVDVYEGEYTYDDNARPKAVVSVTTYVIPKARGYVRKDFDSDMYQLDDESEEGHEQEVDTLKPRDILQLIWNDYRARRKMPDALLYASPGELLSLDLLLHEKLKGIVL